MGTLSPTPRIIAKGWCSVRDLLAALVVVWGTIASAQGPAITETMPVPDGRHFHGTAVLGDNLYVFGGALESLAGPEDNDQTNTVISAPISPTGQLGQWRPNTSLPAPRTYIANSTIVLNDVVYIIGGSDKKLNGIAHNTAIFTKPLPDGTLMPWTTSEPFGTGLNASAAVSTPGFLHIIGGVNKDRKVVNEVWSNALYLDGSLGKWEAGPPLPMPIWFHQAGVAAGRVYLWGGLTSGNADEIKPIPAVFSAPVLGSGRIGQWRQENQFLPTPFYSAASATVGHYLISFSGRYADGVLSGDIWWTYATPNGLVPWRRLPSGIPNRLYHAVAPDFRRGNIYIPAGRPEKVNETPTRRVFYFHLSNEARTQAEQTWQQLQTANTTSTTAKTVAESDAQGVKQLTYQAETQLPVEAVAGFKTVTEARRNSVNQRQPLVLYFTYKDAQPCKEQNQFLQSAGIDRMTGHASFGWVDTTEFPQMAQQMGVYRVPTWIVYDRTGTMRERRVGVLSSEEVVSLVRSVVQ